MPARQITNDLQWAVVCLTALGHRANYVAMVAGLDNRQVHGINQMFEETGAINGNQNAPQPGWP